MRVAPLIATLAVAMAAAVLAPAATVQAGGFYLTDRGVRPMGRGFAFVAGADDPQALWYNPAGLSASGNQFLFDASVTLLSADFTRVDGGGVEQPTVTLDHPVLPLPMLAVSHDLGLEDFTFGAGIFAPNAVLLDWPRGVTSDGSRCNPDTDASCGPAPQRYSLISMKGSALAHIALGAAYTPLEGLSLGFAFQLMVGTFQADVVMSACDGFLCTQPEDADYDGLARVTLSPVIEPGLSFGATYDAGVIRLGLSMLWWPTAIHGDAKLDVRVPSAALFDGARIDGDTAETNIPFPFTLRVGGEVRPTDSLRVEAALVWEHWSSQEALEINPKNVWIRDAIAIGDYEVGRIDVPRNMNDVVSLRLGGELGLLERDALVLRMGLNFESSSFDDSHLTPLTLDSRKFIVGLGASYEVSGGVWLDVSYAHVFMQDRNVSNSAVPQSNPIRPASREPPPLGPSPVGNGVYNMEANMFGLGVRYQFDDGRSASTASDEPDDDEPAADEPVSENGDAQGGGDEVPWYYQGADRQD